jgi:hypothetical protein
LTQIQQFRSRRKSRFLLVRRTRFSLQPKVADDSLDAPNANEMASLLKLLGNHLSRSIRIQESMTNDLPDHLFGAPIVGLWPARFALQSQGALSFNPL